MICTLTAILDLWRRSWAAFQISAPFFLGKDRVVILLRINRLEILVAIRRLASATGHYDFEEEVVVINPILDPKEDQSLRTGTFTIGKLGLIQLGCMKSAVQAGIASRPRVSWDQTAQKYLRELVGTPESQLLARLAACKLGIDGIPTSLIAALEAAVPA